MNWSCLAVSRQTIMAWIRWVALWVAIFSIVPRQAVVGHHQQLADAS
jgi:hypothetical protein